MVELLTITTTVGDSVSARLAMPDDPSPVGILLAHGAGAGQDHPWMATMRERLAATGHPTMTFNYPYTEAGRKRPDRPDRMLAVHAAALARLRADVDRVVLAGKSMGGRLGSHLAGERGEPTEGVVYYGYPLVPPGKGDPRSTDHLHMIAAPQLFFAGTRDRLCPIDLVERLVADLPDAELLVVDGGDHSFRVAKDTGLTADEVLSGLAARTATWIGRKAGL